MNQTPSVHTTCPYCGVGCGVLAARSDDGGIVVAGDPDHPANFGRLCSKGLALDQTVVDDGRLLNPIVDGRASDWDTALTRVAGAFRDTIAAHGPDSVALYVSGQLLTEDYYLANKLMKGFIGSANIDTNSRLCMASTVAGHRRAFGTDTVPGTYEDLDAADLVVLVGSNLAWCHPVLNQRLMAARQARGTKIVVVDPRRTASCDAADLHLPIAPGGDVALFNRLLARIAAEDAVDPDFADGLGEAIAAANADDPAATGLDQALIDQFCRLWIGTERVVTVFSQGVNQSSSGTDKVSAILNCHLATRRIGRAGMGPFSVTGQPNAMGGREVGGLANTLACHMDLDNADHRTAVGRFWNAPTRLPQGPGLKAVEMFEAVNCGRIKALWIIHTNPAVSMPDADAVRDAIAACDFVAVSDITADTDTAQLADVLLPAAGWAEKSGTVTNSDRTISRQRAVRPAPGQARPDWWQIAQVGGRMGWPDAFAHDGPAAIFREHAALSAIAGGFGLDFDISALASISDADYDAMVPIRWPVAAPTGGRFFATGRSFHPHGRLRMVPVSHQAPAATPDTSHPYRLNTGRIRDQWHTMTRTGVSPRLSAHIGEPFVEIHPDDADREGIAPDTLVSVTSPTGGAIVRAWVTDRVRPGQVFVPMHWTGQTAPTGRVDALVAAVTDPISGQPESKAAICSVAPFRAAWYGFAVSDTKMAPASDYWAVARTPTGWRAELGGRAAPSDWVAAGRALFGLDDATPETMIDTRRGAARIAFHSGGRLRAALFAGPDPLALSRDHLAGLPGAAAPHILTGQTPADRPDPGPTICSCFGIGANTIRAAIADAGLQSLDAIGTAVQAGTNCGSCRPELADLLAEAGDRAAEAAE